MIDTHLHLQDLEDPAGAVNAAARAGVHRLITMGVDRDDNGRAIELAELHAEVHAAVGHHPVNSSQPDWPQIERLADHPRVVALGEVGMDAAHPERAAEQDQREWLSGFCQISSRTGLPLSIHTRESEQAVYDVLVDHPGARGVIHYFSLDWEWATRFLELGFYLSFSGLVTRPSRHELREVARRCPAGRLLLETDSPYGTPHGHRGEQNQPAWMVDTAAVVAELRGLTVEQLNELETKNAAQLFPRLRTKALES